MTNQDEATALLSFWQAQRMSGIKPQDRRLPEPREVADSAFERDLEIIRQVLESEP